jgi:hypothetical protein
VETEKNSKDETMKKPEIIQDYNNFMHSVDRADQILQYCPFCMKTMKWTKKSLLLLLHMAALNSFILSNNYTTNEIQKHKGYAFKDFILDSVRKNDGARRGRRRE